MTTTMDGKLCVITGGTDGIGRSTAEGLARLGASVVIVGRDAQKAADVAAAIRVASGNSQVRATVADLTSQAEIRRLAADLLGDSARIDVLINNVGARFARRLVTEDGIEKTLALNHLASFLLTNLLLEAIKASAPARVINVSSAAHLGSIINFDDIQSERSYVTMRVYGASKLANVMFTTELAHRLEGTGVTANAVHPGLANTEFNRNGGGVWPLAWRVLAPLLARSPERGAETSIYLASSPEVEDVTGRYFANCKVARMALRGSDVALTRRLWQVSAELVGLPPDVAGVGVM
jgi:NAD(P)-dependent dehydrogenase (short-subunit alcohol dehydrogenase family)